MRRGKSSTGVPAGILRAKFSMSATVIAGRIIPIISRILNFTRLKSRFSLTFAGGSFCARMRGRNAGGLKHPPLLGFA